jgi:hypothetical protein
MDEAISSPGLTVEDSLRTVGMLASAWVCC